MNVLFWEGMLSMFWFPTTSSESDGHCEPALGSLSIVLFFIGKLICIGISNFRTFGHYRLPYCKDGKYLHRHSERVIYILSEFMYVFPLIVIKTDRLNITHEQ